jgi:hypothetical protein
MACWPTDSVLNCGMNYLADLRSTVERLHVCVAAHSRTELVREKGECPPDRTIAVEVFALLGHDRALRCYAWGEWRDERWEVTTVLALPPVISARTAVLAALLAKLESSRAAN